MFYLSLIKDIYFKFMNKKEHKINLFVGTTIIFHDLPILDLLNHNRQTTKLPTLLGG
jgi:hypothetical protein